MKFHWFACIVVFLFSCGERKINSTIEYNSSWEFKNQKDSIWHMADVPGEVHLDLLANDLILNPYENDNEKALEWIENENWEYKSEWKINDELLENEHIELFFEGLDTYSKVYINDSLVLESENMFRTYGIEVKSILRPGKNNLRIEFTSPLKYNREKVKNYPFRLPSGNETGNLQVSSFTRKAAYQFGWDWGPRFVSMGIWRPMKVHTWNDYRLEDVYVITKSIKNDEALIDVIVEVQSDIVSTEKIVIDNKTYAISLDIGTNEYRFPMMIEKPNLWWPNGAGEPTLHHMEVKLLRDESEIDEKKISYGIRTVELVNEPDSIGTSYYFKVNGKSIFMKGANYIPQDIFPSRVSNDQYRSLIEKVKEANMNMLRVWGGGIYEKDLFYDLCDQNGILVWQDFMFAGSMYPLDESFHQNVAKEVQDNVRRLRSHPSLALWCGNNEIEVAWKNWGWIKQFGYSAEDSVAIWKNYLQLFDKEIPAIVDSQAPHINYVTTSPLSNWGTPENFNHSSMHYWGVWHGREPLENYKINVGRFMSEYGFQSFPSIKSLANVIDSPYLKIDSKVMNQRQKSYIGNEMITNVSEQYFGASQDFEEYIVKSQKTQSLALKMAIQSHRLSKPHCMGTLFWQLNDVWQGPSWSVLEYDGTPKLAYETVKKWYLPVVVIPKIRGDSIDFFVVSDKLEKEMFEVRIATPTDNFDSTFTIDPNEVLKIYSMLKTDFSVDLLEKGKVIFSDQTDNWTAQQ